MKKRRLAATVIVGYVLSVVVAVVVTVAFFLAPTVFPDQGRWGSFYKETQQLPAILVFGFMFTATTALPGYVISLVVAHRKNTHSQKFYIVAGVLTAILAHFVLAAFMQGGFFGSIYVVISSLPGGAVGGYTYYCFRNWMLSSVVPKAAK